VPDNPTRSPKNSSSMPREKKYFSVTKTYFLMVPRAVIVLYSESHMKHVDRLREKGTENFNVKAAG